MGKCTSRHLFSYGGLLKNSLHALIIIQAGRIWCCITLFKGKHTNYPYWFQHSYFCTSSGSSGNDVDDDDDKDDEDDDDDDDFDT